MINDNRNRRKTLRKEEPIFLQQSPALQVIGNNAAGRTQCVEVKAALRDLDLLVWDESEKYFSRFAEDFQYAPSIIQDLLTETADIGSNYGMEFTLSPLVLAFVKVRILAGGDDVYEKYYHLLCAIETSQRMNAQTKPIFDKYCKFLMLNKKDPSTGKETIYRRGDPIDRLKGTAESKTEVRLENLLGQILEATKGWNTKKAFGDYWSQWTELWLHLLEQDKQGELFEKLSQKCPKSRGNFTSINIRLVCNVAGLLKRHLEENLKHTTSSNIPDQDFAKLIKESWSSDSCRKAIKEIDELINTVQVSQINGWLAINIK